MNKLGRLINRLKNIGVEIKLGANYPWVYLDYINGIRVTEKNAANHGFCIGYLNEDFDFTYSKETFKIIRKYVNHQS